jgi:hypothetical protein
MGALGLDRSRVQSAAPMQVRRMAKPRRAARRYDKKLEPVLRARRRVGRHMPVMNVIPPGLDFSNLKARVLAVQRGGSVQLSWLRGVP